MASKIIKQSSNFIRKLDLKEVGLIKRGWDQNVLFTYPIHSKLDLFEPKNLNILKSSISNVMKSEEFMRARIVKAGEQDYYYERFNMDKYNFENVKFLRLNSSNKTSLETKDYIAKLIFHYCGMNEINPDKDDSIPIWKLFIFEAGENSRIFHFVCQYHHSLVQGHLGTLNLYKILKTFELLHQNKEVEYKESKIYPGCEKLFNFKKDYDSAAPLKPIKQPSFINKERAEAEAIKLFDQSIPKDLDMNAELICVDSQNRFKSISNLIETCRHSHSNQRNSFLNGDEFKKIIFRCKKEGVKFNSAFELLCCLALKKLYESYDASNDEFSNLVYHTVVSLRDGQRTGQGSFGENVMGLITGGLLTHPDTSAINRILENRDGLSELFWPLAKKWSNEMHNRLKNDPTRYFVKVNPPSKEEMNFHFTTSNMGVHFSSEDSDLEYFRFEIKKLASYPTSNKSANSRMFIIWICVYLDNLCFGLNFNSHFVDVSMMERYLNIFKSLLDELAKKETIQSNI